MMKVCYMLATLFILSLPATAQVKKDNAPHPEAPAKKESKEKKLGLNSQQSADIKKAKTSYKEKKTAVEADSKLTAKEKKEKIKGLKEEKKSKVNAVLTPEQREKKKSMKKKKGKH